MPTKWLRRILWRKERETVAGPRAHASGEPAARPAPRRAARLPSLATATRDYARAVEAGLLDRKHREDLDRWAAAMGPAIWSWQRALRLTDQPAWRASPNAEDEHERRRAYERLLSDVPTWEKALMALDGQMRRAHMRDRAPPPPLAVPQEVIALIEAKRAAALERAGKARTRGEGGGSPPALRPDEDLSHPPYPTPR